MKTIELYTGEQFNSKTVFTELLTVPVEGCTVTDMRKYFKMMDKLEVATDTVQFEDVEYSAMWDIFDKTKFRFTHKDLVEIGDRLAKPQ